MTPPFEALRGARIVATLPSIKENDGWFMQSALQQIEALRAYGAEVFPFDVTYSHTGDLAALLRQLTQLGEFKPEIAISTPSATQVLRCRMGQVVMADDWYVPNQLFVDNLRLPTILLWDGMTEFFITLGVPRLDPAASRHGVLAALRDQINNPLYFHCAFDRQHVDSMRALGVLTTEHVRVYLPPAYPHFVAYGYQNDTGFDDDVAFAGNLFSPRPARGTGDAQQIIERFKDTALQAAADDVSGNYWNAIQRARDALSEADAATAKLQYDESFFWEFIAVDVMSSLITQSRLRALSAARHPVDVYGLIFDPQSERLLADRPNLRFRGKADYITGLPRLNRRSKVTLDVVTAHFPNSTTAKIAGCFAAGGLCLFDAKPAFRDAFGPDAERVMYRDLDDMNAKIDHLLTHDRERAELAAFFQAGIRERHTFIGLLAEMVAWVRQSGAA